LLGLSKVQDGQPYDMHHVLQFLQYEEQEMQWQLEEVEAKPHGTIAIYSEKQENNHQKIILMLGSKN
jgi:hypothetical protein